jgi:hypothetical protein
MDNQLWTLDEGRIATKIKQNKKKKKKVALLISGSIGRSSISAVTFAV